MLARFALAATALALPTAAQTPRPCISEAQSRATIAYIMPSLATELARKCAASLPEGAYLTTRAARLASEWTPASERAWPLARGVVAKLGNIPIPPGSGAEQFAKTVVGPAAAGAIARDFDPKACAATDRLMAELEPLPPENVAGVLALFLELGAEQNKQLPFRVCPAN